MHHAEIFSVHWASAPSKRSINVIDCSFELNDKPISSFKMGAPSFPAFSGLDKHVNRTVSQCISGQGPIPKGTNFQVMRSLLKCTKAIILIA